jgi:hypothetical protein
MNEVDRPAVQRGIEERSSSPSALYSYLCVHIKPTQRVLEDEIAYLRHDADKLAAELKRRRLSERS